MNSLKLHQEQLLDLLSSSLFLKESKETELSLENLNEAKQHAVLSLIDVEMETFPQVYGLRSQLLLNNLRVEYEHAEVHKILTEAGIPYVILKGMASAAFYPEPSLRTMGDVDLLVEKELLCKVDEVLSANGFQAVENNEHEYHTAYHRKNYGSTSIWEVHWKAPGIPVGSEGEKIQTYLSEIIESAEIKEIPEGAYMLPNEFHHGLVMLLHVAGHLINTGIGLRHLCDWAVFVATFSDEEFCSMFEEKLKEVGLWRFAQLLAQLSIKYLGCPQKEWCGKNDEEYLEKMMQDIMDGGNFGEKDANRINQAKLMTNTGKGVDDTSLLKQFFLTMSDKAKRGMPIVTKVPILLPVGWIYVGGRHLLRVMQGRRPSIDVGDMISGATKRKEIYREFRLFESENDI